MTFLLLSLVIVATMQYDHGSLDLATYYIVIALSVIAMAIWKKGEPR